jgi:tuftelin-interacting protein 11
VVLGREQQRMEEEVEAVQQQVEHAAAILEEVQRCQSGAAASSLDEKEQVYRRLKARYREEYILYNLADAALAQVASESFYVVCQSIKSFPPIRQDQACPPGCD